MKNRICEILGIEKPIIQGPMVWLTDAKLVAAVSNAGGMGSLGPNAGQTVVTRDPIETAERMRQEIKKVRSFVQCQLIIVHYRAFLQMNLLQWTKPEQLMKN